MLSKNKGITLIALVITIIVLLILAGVSISAVMGENGIATKAKEAKKEMKAAEVEEMAGLIASEYAVDNDGEGPSANYIISELVSRNYIEESQIVDNGQYKEEGIIEVEGEQITIKGTYTVNPALEYLTITSDGAVNIKNADLYYDLNIPPANGDYISGKDVFPLEEIVIPEKIDGITVTTLGEEFVIGKGVKVLKFPKTLTSFFDMDVYGGRFYIAPDLEEMYVYSNLEESINTNSGAFRNFSVIYLDK